MGGMRLLPLGRTGSHWPTLIYSFHLTLIFYIIPTFPLIIPIDLISLLLIPFLSY